MNCRICNKKLVNEDRKCPVCGSDQQEEVELRCGGYYVRGRANTPPCKIVVTKTRIVAVDDYATFGSTVGRGGGGTIGSMMGETMGNRMDRKLKKPLVDFDIASIVEINLYEKTFFSPLVTCEIKTGGGDTHSFKVDEKSTFLTKIKEFFRRDGHAHEHG